MALRARGYDDLFPFDRSSAVYCYFDANRTEKIHELASEFANDDVVIVVDLERVPAPLYLADMRAATEFVDYGVAPETAPMTDTFEDAVKQYRESIVRIDGLGEASEQKGASYDHPELIVDGDIPTEAILDVCG